MGTPTAGLRCRSVYVDLRMLRPVLGGYTCHRTLTAPSHGVRARRSAKQGPEVGSDPGRTRGRGCAVLERGVCGCVAGAILSAPPALPDHLGGEGDRARVERFRTRRHRAGWCGGSAGPASQRLPRGHAELMIMAYFLNQTLPFLGTTPDGRGVMALAGGLIAYRSPRVGAGWKRRGRDS